MAEFQDQLFRQPTNDDDCIIDSLRPIFPQFGDAVFQECIANTRRMFAEADPNAILTEAINFLLAGTYHELQVEENDEVDHRNDVIVLNNEGDDVVYLRTSNTKRDGPIFVDDLSEPPRNYVKNAVSTNTTSDSVEIIPGDEPFVQPTTAGACRVDQDEQVPQPSEPAGTSVLTSDHDNPGENSRAISCDEQPVDLTEKAFQELRRMFTNAEEGYLRNLLQQWPGSPYEMLVNNACNSLLENSYPKKETAVSEPSTSKDEAVQDYFTHYSVPVSALYQRQCLEVLDHDFRMVRMKDIRTALKRFNFHYAPCKKALEEGLAEALNEMQQGVYNASLPSSYSVPPSSTVTQQPKPTSTVTQQPKPTTKKSSCPVSVHLLRYGRSPRKMPAELVPELQKEVDFVKKLKLECTAELDHLVALVLNEQQYQEEGQLIECGCCYGEAAFEQMVQCMEGHLFCGDCLKSYAKEAAFGEGKALLTCMTDGCSSTFPVSQLKQCLPTNILTKYEDRVQEESLSLAQVEDLVKCPGCDYAVIMPPGDKVFKCQDPLCAKEICRYCKEDWSEHFGLPCSEVEKGNEKNLRLSYEERMTMAKIRKCAKCGCEFTKSTGCNKMTCRCGATQCYVCRKASIHYSHFCSHPRDPGQKCGKCTSCSLWSDPSEDDDRAVKELEAEAVEAKRKLDSTAAGNSQENPHKKVRLDEM